MRTRYHLGTIWGVRVSLKPPVVLGWILLWGMLIGMGVGWLHAAWIPVLLGALLAALLHLLSELIHQVGHVWAARWTGYPMTDLELWWAFSTSRYPQNEPALPAEVHLWRAVGGPVASGVLTLLAAGLALALYQVGGIVWWVGVYFFLENLFVFTLGALLPLGFTDGSSLWYWGRRWIS
jgi:hypothetical protein